MAKKGRQKFCGGPRTETKFVEWSASRKRLRTAALETLFDIMNTELKTNYILFRSPRPKINDINLYLNKIPITRSHTSKFSGVIIDQYLSWKDHIIYNFRVSNIRVSNRTLIYNVCPKSALT